MKKRVIKVLFLFSLMLFASCGKELPDNLNNYEVNKEGNNGSSPLKSLIINDVSFTTYGGSEIVSLGNIDVNKFLISSDAFWCSVSYNSSTSFKITATENETTDDRFATITITDKEDKTTLSFKVSQKASAPFLTVDKDEIEVDANGGMIEITIKTNLDNFSTYPDEDWIITFRKEKATYQEFTYVQKLLVDQFTKGSGIRKGSVEFVGNVRIGTDIVFISKTVMIIQRKDV